MLRATRMSLGLFLISAAATMAWSQAVLNISGVWKQDNERCVPRRNGEVILRIGQHDPKLIIETTASSKSGATRQASQKYTTDGTVSVTTGTDGDEFHTSIAPVDSTLVFSVEEHEDGRILQSKETWSIIEGGATLKRVRDRPNGETQTLFFRRLPSGLPESPSKALKAGK